MAINKVEINGEVKLDLTQDTVAEDTLLNGVTAHDAAGNPIEGKVVTTPVPKTSNLLKGDGQGGVTAAVPGTDYLKTAPVTSINGKTGAVTLGKSDVGLGSVDNVKQYSATNPPPYPVTSVNGQTGDVNLTASDVGAVPTSRTVNGKALSANITLAASDVGALPSNTHIPSTVAEMSDAGNYALKSDKVSKSGDTMTGKLTVPQVETGDGNSNFFQCRKFRGEGDANTYYHAIDFGYKSHDRVDFHEYGGIWNFFKNTSGKANEGVLCGSITSNGWEGRAKLKSGSTMVTSQLTENSDAIATTAFVHGLVDNVKHYSASNPPPYPVTSVNNKTGAVTLAKGDVGLGNVDNTSDANKPISKATQAALNNKQSKITANGILKGDGTGAVTAAEETEVELVDLPQQVFWATYGKTTPAELNAAWNAGKLIKLKQGPTSYELGIKDGNKAYFYGVLINSGDGSVRRAKLDLKNGTWEQDTIGSVCDIVQTISLPTASWTGSDPYTQKVTIFNSNAKTKVDIQPSEEVYDQLVADNVGYLAIKNVNGTLTAVAKGGKPSVDLTVQVTYNNVY